MADRLPSKQSLSRSLKKIYAAWKKYANPIGDKYELCPRCAHAIVMMGLKKANFSEWARIEEKVSAKKTRSAAVCCYRSNVHWRVNMKQLGCSRAGSPLATRRSGEGIQRLSYFGSNYNFPANFLSANTRAIANSVYHQNVVCCQIGQENFGGKMKHRQRQNGPKPLLL